MSETHPYRFRGFRSPRYTQVPDEVFDELLAPGVLTEAELRVLLYIIRRTFGFKKESDAISLSQITDGIVKGDGERLDWGAGIQRKAAGRAVQGLEEKGIIRAERRRSKERGNETTIYHLVWASDAPQSPKDPRDTPPWSPKDPSPGVSVAGSLESQRLPQQTAVQETVKQETGDSNPPSPEKNQEPDNDSGKHREEEGKPPYSPYIARVLMDFSLELDDPAHTPSNVTQALRLWGASGLTDEAFVQECYAAKRLLRQAQAHGVTNKMAYFFTVLRRALAPADASAA